MKKIIGTYCFIVLTFISFSQTTTLNPTIDAFVDNQSPTINYGSSSYTYLEVGVKVLGRTKTVRRSFLQFDLSSIPQNAIITSASLILTKVSEGTDVTNSSFSLQRVDQTTTQWLETGVNWNNQPVSITSDAINTSSSNSTERIFDVKDHVSKMVSGMYANRGWIIKRANETVATLGSTYNSRHTTPQPRLVVNYYIPYNLSNVVYNHASSTSSANGSINVTLANGSTSTPTYKWYTNGTTLIPSATTNQLSNVGYGWYGLKVIGSQGDTSCFAFVLGVNCQNVSINFNPGPEYVDDAVLSELSVNANIGSDYVLYASHFFMSPTYKNFKSLLKFRFWLDPNMTFNQANMLLIGNEHNTDSRSNASQLDAVTTNWSEKSVCWFNQPTSVTTTQVLIPATTTIDENKTLNMIPFMNLWKNSNSTNYGALFKLQSSADPAATMAFNSSDATSASLRPTMSLNVFINNAVAGTVSSTNSNICNGSTTSLNLTGYSTGASFQWQKSTNGTSYTAISGATSSTYTTLASTNVDTYYRCVVTVGTCSSLISNPLLITIKPVPTVAVNDAVFCIGENVSLTAVPSIAGGTFLWSTNETTNSINVAPSANQNYTVMYTLNGCSSRLDTSIVRVCESIYTFNDTTEYGTVDVDINDVDDKVGPFKYQISEYSNEEMSTLYQFFKDSIYNGQLDSASFFEGNISQSSYRFEHLKMGRKFVSVFDSRGVRIFDREIHLFPSIELTNHVNLGVENNRIFSSANNGSGIAEVFFNEQDNVDIIYKIEDINKNQKMGLVNSTISDASNLQNYVFGFSVKNGLLYTIEQGVLSTTSNVISNDSELELRYSDSIVGFYLNGNLLKSSQTTGEFYYKHGFSFESLGTSLNFFPNGVSKKKYYFLINNLHYYNCNGQNGGFVFNALRANQTSYNYDWLIKKDGSPILSGSSQGGPVTIISNCTYGAGIYEIICDPQVTGVANFSEFVYLGYETEWGSLFNYSNVTPNNYSLERTNINLGSFSYGIAENILEPNIDGWLSFNPIISSFGTGSNNYLRLSTLNPSSVNPVLGEVGILQFKKIQGQTKIFWTGPNPGNATITSNPKVRLKITSSNLIQIYINDNLLSSFQRPSNGAIMLRAHSLKPYEGFDNIITSFDCAINQPLSTIEYAELKKDMDGGFTFALEGKLKFTFDENYLINESLKFVPFSIVDKTQEVLASSDLNGVVFGNVLPIEYKNDDGRYELNLSNVQGMNLGDFYTLEILTPKGDKKYLKFQYK